MKTKTSRTMIVVLAATLMSLPLRAASNDDARIVSAAKQSYVYRTHLKDDHVQIQSKDGVVTLTGEVTSPRHKEMAQDVVEGLPGVKSVNNQLAVKPADEPTDSRLRWQIKSALLFHRSVSGTKTDVAVDNGIVTLTGTASSEAQKELTAEYAKDIEGVKEVKNELKVVPEPPSRRVGEVIDDTSITAQVKAALLTHRSTSALKTKVTTRNGVVTLTGQAKNQAEKDLVTKVTSDINGVKSVVNEMEVK